MLSQIAYGMPNSRSRSRKKALFIAPYFDEATRSSSLTVEIAEEIFSSLASSSETATETGLGAEWEIWELEVDDAVRSNFDSVITDDGPFDLVVYGGHGDTGGWIGQVSSYSYSAPTLKPGERLMDSQNIGLLRGTIAVSIACLAGVLAPLAVQQGCRAFVGSDDFIFVGFPYEGIKNYRADFVRTFEAIILSLAHGLTVSESIEYFVRVCKDYEDEYEKDKPKYYETFMANMGRNARSVRAWGDSNAAIEP